MTYGKITNKQREVLEYLKQHGLQKGYPPSVREICDAVGLKSTSSAHAHLESLERNGYIRKDPTKPRAIEIVDDGFNLVRTETVYISFYVAKACADRINHLLQACLRA